MNTKRETASREQRREQMEAILTKIEGRIGGDAEKVSVADLIRIFQFERELNEGEQPGEIRVTWVETTETLDIDE